MSLYEDVAQYEAVSRTESSLDIEDLISSTGAVEMETNYYDSGRWFDYFSLIIERDEEFVEVVYPEPSTEMQEVEDGSFEYYKVTPQDVVKVEYIRS